MMGHRCKSKVRQELSDAFPQNGTSSECGILEALGICWVAVKELKLSCYI